MESSILLGYEYDYSLTDEEVSFDISELLFNVEIYGMIGRGKTRLVCSIIQQLFHNRVPILVFDKGEYAARRQALRKVIYSKYCDLLLYLYSSLFFL